MEPVTRKEATMSIETMITNLEATIRVLEHQSAMCEDIATTCNDPWLKGYYEGCKKAFGLATKFVKEDMGKGE